MEKILIIGANGQLGTDLTQSLCEIYGVNNVIASDISKLPHSNSSGISEILDVTNKINLAKVVSTYGITQIYNLASILSARAEQNNKLAWEVNLNGLLNVLEIAKEAQLTKVFWPSSIAVFGPDTPPDHTPQVTIMNPKTVYGISKLAGERWCEYYFEKYSIDVRSLRFPGLIGYSAPPGGGTTDYAVDIYHKALQKGSFESFLSENTKLPFMYMEDAIKAIHQLMEAEPGQIKVRSSYNVTAFSITPFEIAASIRKYIPDFRITYAPDARQKIADNWPHSIDDSEARRDWNWNHTYDLNSMTVEMLEKLGEKIT